MNFIAKNILAISLFFSGTGILATDGRVMATDGVMYEPVFYGPEAPGISHFVGNLIRTLAAKVIGDTAENSQAVGEAVGGVVSAIPNAVSSALANIGSTYAFQSLMHYFYAPINVPTTGYSCVSSTDNCLSWAAKIAVGGAIVLSARYAYKKCKPVINPFVKGAADITSCAVRHTVNAAAGAIKGVGKMITR